MFACMKGVLGIVKMLLDFGADLNVVGSGRSPLMIACQFGHYAIVDLLISSGAVVNFRTEVSEMDDTSVS